ncbi:hypothetical protein AVEN_161122-1 [Araneus ventricosus]|uniref:Uncharacterized protein n=1 Tax=Araneus ventricosus TaxID=182803 RepID=A0A4Y2K5G9_ARAVE|nr:hypothetical protein AVEN_161122-1 [Araneus ventricosus]
MSSTITFLEGNGSKDSGLDSVKEEPDDKSWIGSEANLLLLIGDDNNVDVSFSPDIPTYSCPCEKHSSVKYKPVTRSDCPCALLIVIANLSRRGNCNRWKEKDKPVGMSDIL